MANRSLSLRQNEQFNPWASFQDEMRDLLDRFYEDWADFPAMRVSSTSHFVPRVDVQDRGDSYFVTAEIPGMTEKDININLEQNVLILEGEKKSEAEEKKKGYFKSEISYGSFYRSIPLNDEVDESKVQASYKDGMLKIALGKKEGMGKKKKKIEISTHTQIQ